MLAHRSKALHRITPRFNQQLHRIVNQIIRAHRHIGIQNHNRAIGRSNRFIRMPGSVINRRGVMRQLSGSIDDRTSEFVRTIVDIRII